jgi:NAD(P)-dependent dehydrogenase (short-subunit alcohol dehydrogenase family)
VPRVFITGSTDGLGFGAARQLVEAGHQVVLHARNAGRAEDARRRLPACESVVVGDLASIAETRGVAEQVNRLGRFDAVIHNAAVGYEQPRIETEDGLPQIFAVNALAPYVLTALVLKPGRLVYLSSGMHRGANASLEDVAWTKRRWRGPEAYAESKLMNLLLAFAVARRWPSVLSNAVNPGWVPTKMGGPGAPDDLETGCRTQAWLATSDEPGARVSGTYLHHLRPQSPDPAAHDGERQDRFLDLCLRYSGVAWPDASA